MNTFLEPAEDNQEESTAIVRTKQDQELKGYLESKNLTEKGLMKYTNIIKG